MRRLLAVLVVACFGLPLLAAAPDAFSIKPAVIVYPFVANGSSLDREASSRLATIIATNMANTKLVTVVPPPPGTERKDYLNAARSHNADYYVSGYLSPLGNGVSLVEQVVSAASGIVIFSQSAQVTTYADAAGQGDDLAGFIARHANRGLAGIGTPPPAAASPTPGPSSGPEANLGKLFRRKKSTPAPAPKPSPSVRPATVASTTILAAPAPPTAAPVPVSTPVAVAAPKTVAAAGTGPGPAPGSVSAAVLAVDGPADAALRELATQRVVAHTGGERAATPAAACGAHAARILSGSLIVRPASQFGGGSATFELVVTDCAGKMLWPQSRTSDAGGAQASQLAPERAVDAVVGAYLNPPKPRR